MLMTLVAAVSASAAPVRVPFELHNNHIYLRTMVNGKGPFFFLFDTGAGSSGSMIDSSVAAGLALPVEGQLNAGMIGGSKGVSYTGAAKYKIGRLSFDEKRTAFFELKGQEKEEGHRVDGIFGYSLIREYVIEVNYRSRTLTFYKPGEFKGIGKAAMLALSETAKYKVPVVEAAVTTPDGRRIDVSVTVDTGYDGSLLLGRKFVENNNLKRDAAAPSDPTGSGLGGSTTLAPGRIQRLDLGSLKVVRPATIFAFDKEGNFSGENAIIGGALLNRYKLVLNYKEGYLLLQ